MDTILMPKVEQIEATPKRTNALQNSAGSKWENLEPSWGQVEAALPSASLRIAIIIQSPLLLMLLFFK